MQDEVENKYKVTFTDFDGQIFNVQYVEYGQSAFPPPNPTLEGFVFSGWEPSYNNITGDTTCVAQYEEDSQKKAESSYDSDYRKIPMKDIGYDSTKNKFKDREIHTITISKNANMIQAYTSQ